MIRQTSIKSFEKLQPLLSKRQQTMLDAFKAAPTKTWTDRQLAKFLHWEINRVTPRRGELKDLGLIVECGFRWDDETKRNATVWRLKA